MERVRGGPGGRYLQVDFTFRRVPPTSSALLSLGGFLPAHRIAPGFSEYMRRPNPNPGDAKTDVAALAQRSGDSGGCDLYLVAFSIST